MSKPRPLLKLVGFKLPKDEAEKLRLTAYSEGKNVSEYLRSLISEKYKQLETEKTE